MNFKEHWENTSLAYKKWLFYGFGLISFSILVNYTRDVLVIILVIIIQIMFYEHGIYHEKHRRELAEEK